MRKVEDEKSMETWPDFENFCAILIYGFVHVDVFDYAVWLLIFGHLLQMKKVSR